MEITASRHQRPPTDLYPSDIACQRLFQPPVTAFATALETLLYAPSLKRSPSGGGSGEWPLKMGFIVAGWVGVGEGGFGGPHLPHERGTGEFGGRTLTRPSGAFLNAPSSWWSLLLLPALAAPPLTRFCPVTQPSHCGLGLPLAFSDVQTTCERSETCLHQHPLHPEAENHHFAYGAGQTAAPDTHLDVESFAAVHMLLVGPACTGSGRKGDGSAPPPPSHTPG